MRSPYHLLSKPENVKANINNGSWTIGMNPGLSWVSQEIWYSSYMWCLCFVFIFVLFCGKPWELLSKIVFIF